MKLKDCVAAWTALTSLFEAETDYATAHALTTLKRRLRPHVEFYAGEEKKLVDKYGKHDQKGKIVYSSPGNVEFEDYARFAEFRRERDELGEVDITEKFPNLIVSAPERMSPAAVEALERFVSFKEAVK